MAISFKILNGDFPIFECYFFFLHDIVQETQIQNKSLIVVLSFTQRIYYMSFVLYLNYSVNQLLDSLWNEIYIHQQSQLIIPKLH